MTTAHIPQTLLHPDTVALGRLTTNANRPHTNSHDPLPPRPDPPEKHIVKHTSLTETRRFSKGSTHNFNLGQLISLVTNNSSTSTSTLTAPNATTYDLKNYDSWFRDACKNSETRLWLQDSVERGRDVYLIVGYRTADSASLKSSASSRSTSKVGGSLPVRAFAPPGPVNVAFSDPVGSGTRSAGDVRNLEFTAVGEQVFAVLYKKVKFKWLSSRKVENMNLEEGNRWKTVWDWRGAKETEAEEDDVLEADLTDLSDLEDDDEEEEEAEEKEEEEEEEEEEEQAGYEGERGLKNERLQDDIKEARISGPADESQGQQVKALIDAVKNSGAVDRSSDLASASGSGLQQVKNTRWPSTSTLLGLLLLPLLALLLQWFYTGKTVIPWRNVF